MADRQDPALRWLDRVAAGGAPIYLRVADALDAAVRAGELQPGDQVPPQRAVAQALGVDLTTVTRAYSTARARGLLEGAVGRGTFVRTAAAADEAGRVDLTMNLPPPPQGVSLSRLLAETTAAILDRTDAAVLMAYHPGGGSLGQRVAGAAWLAPVIGEIAPDEQFQQAHEIGDLGLGARPVLG
ncbi:MAG: GntR family transcriptional regulator, partial [Phenylobacterium sp.]|nr:GntR family transcriptional regulator [Phenylobacterium sp.]